MREQKEDKFIESCRERKLPTPTTEFKFHSERGWSFDYVWQRERVAVEIDGGAFMGGRHVRGAGFAGDQTKINEATRLGWRVFRFLTSDVESGFAARYMMSVLLDAPELRPPLLASSVKKKTGRAVARKRKRMNDKGRREIHRYVRE